MLNVLRVDMASQHDKDVENSGMTLVDQNRR